MPVTFALWEGELWTVVDGKPKGVPPDRLARVRFLRRRPAAALTVDRYSEDWNRLAWVQTLGDVRILDVEEARGPLGALAAKYQPYRFSPPPGPLLGLAPRRIISWRAAP